jgi:hypothetical protein
VAQITAFGNQSFQTGLIVGQLEAKQFSSVHLFLAGIGDLADALLSACV